MFINKVGKKANSPKGAVCSDSGSILQCRLKKVDEVQMIIVVNGRLKILSKIHTVCVKFKDFSRTF